MAKTKKEKTNKKGRNKVLRVLRIIKNVLLTVIIVFLSIVLIVSVISRITGNPPSLFGFSLYRVSSGSMRPELEVKDIILVRSCDGEDVEKGDNEKSDLGLLIRAYRDPSVAEDNYDGPGAFSEEEKERYKKIDLNDLTDYQKDMYSAAQKTIADTKTYNSVSSGIVGLASSLSQARIDLLKDDSMVKVQKAADTINGQAVDQNMLALIGEGIEKLEEDRKEQEEQEERAKAAEEKKEALEKQKGKSDTDISDTVKKVDDTKKELDDTQKELDKIVKDMGAFSDRLEELYGLVVDGFA